MKTYARRRTTKRSPQPKEQPSDVQLVVEENRGPGEEVRIYEADVAGWYHGSMLQAGKVRLFDPSRDDRGPEVPVILTYGVRADTWFPKTQGVYLVEFSKPKDELPEEIRNCSLGMGSCSGPQFTLAGIHRVWLMITSDDLGRKLAPHLQIVKKACVFVKDAPEATGGSRVIIDLATLPPPCKDTEISRTYF